MNAAFHIITSTTVVETVQPVAIEPVDRPGICSACRRRLLRGAVFVGAGKGSRLRRDAFFIFCRHCARRIGRAAERK